MEELTGADLIQDPLLGTYLEISFSLLAFWSGDFQNLDCFSVLSSDPGTVVGVCQASQGTCLDALLGTCHDSCVTGRDALLADVWKASLDKR